MQGAGRTPTLSHLVCPFLAVVVKGDERLRDQAAFSRSRSK